MRFRSLGSSFRRSRVSRNLPQTLGRTAAEGVEPHVPGTVVPRPRRIAGGRGDPQTSRHDRGVPDPDARDARCARWPRRAREVADRLGQDPRVRDPDRRAHRPEGGHALGARAGPRLASSRCRSPRSSPTSRKRRACGSALRTAARAIASRAGSSAAPMCSSRRRGASTTSRPEARSLSVRCASSSSMRPTACSTWASSRRWTASSRRLPEGAPDDVLLGDARRRRRARRRRLHAHAEAARGRDRRARPSEELEHRFVPVAAQDKVDTLVRAARSTSAELALVFVRTKRGADRLVQRLKAKGVRAERDARRHEPAGPRAGARPVRGRARSTCSSRPTSPRAASTSTASPT